MIRTPDMLRKTFTCKKCTFPWSLGGFWLTFYPEHNQPFDTCPACLGWFTKS